MAKPSAVRRASVKPAHADPVASESTSQATGVYVRQAAQMVGASASMIRTWENEGLVTPGRKPSGYRIYTMADVQKLRRIRTLRDQGLNVPGIRRVLKTEFPHDLRPVPAMDQDGLGTRLKNMRAASGASLRDISQSTGLSASYLSSVERSMSSPSIASLQKIAAALGTNLPNLLGDESDERREVVRVGERPRLRYPEKGMRIERLSVNETMLEPLLFIVKPGAGSEEPYEHDGEEFIFVQKGEFTITLDGSQTHSLGTGDSITFRSRRPHTWSNPGSTDTHLIWVNTPPTF
jgi:DNA-binding transcriptional MerR regulator/mannose-6-phosphate isomerase-like protein (cupin superfamily)